MLSSVACTEQDLVQRMLHTLMSDCRCICCRIKRLHVYAQSGEVVYDDVMAKEMGDNNRNYAPRTETVQNTMKDPREGGPAPNQPNYEGTKFASQAQTVLYADEARDAIYDVSTSIPKAIDMTEHMDIVNFLSRPLKLSTITWNTATSVGSDLLSGIQVYETYLSNAIIANKIANFAFLRATMKIKIVINSTPFNYGAARLVWQPGARAGSTNPLRVPLAASSTNLMSLSQLPGVWIYPQNNQGVTMTLPYTNPYTWIDMRGATHNWWRARDMGQLNLIVYNALASANGTTPSVSVTVYGWLENVELSAPSNTLFNQSGDILIKQSRNRIAPSSSDAQPPPRPRVNTPAASAAPAPPARRVAWSDQIESASSKIETLNDVPILGDYAKIVSNVGKGVSKVAKALGFSDPTSIEDVHPLKVQNAPVFASPDISYPYQPLAVDYKNETSIDPAICGLKTEDELSIRAFTSKESYLTTFTFDQTTAAETVLSTFNVTPDLKVFDPIPGTGYNGRFLHTPLSLVSSFFDYWRGSIKLRFVVVASPFHKARLKIQHEPAPNNVNYYAGTGFEQTLQTAILDVGVDQDYTMTIPYQNFAAWLRCRDIMTRSQDFVVSSSAPAGNSAYNASRNNGQVYVRLLNTLSSPAAASTVSVNVFVSAGDDFEVASPSEMPRSIDNLYPSLWVLQSADYVTLANKQSTVVGESKTEELAIPPSIRAPTHLYHEYMGERVGNLRQLLRRKVKYLTIATPVASAGGPTYISIGINGEPLMTGVNPNGQLLVRNLAGTANIPFNPARLSPLTILRSCFLGWRGSVNWLITDDARTLGSLVAHKEFAVGTTNVRPLNTFSQITLPTSSSNVQIALAAGSIPYRTAALTSGGAFEPRETGAPLALTIPFYARAKMLPCDDTIISAATTGERPSRITITGYLQPSTYAQISTYVSAGIDYNLFYFQYVPIIYEVLYADPA